MKYSVIFGLIILLITLVAACDPFAQGMGLQDAVTRAITHTCEATSYRSTSNSTSNDGSISYGISYEKEYAAPDSWHVLNTVTQCAGETAYSEWIEVVAVGETAYKRSLLQPEWRICTFFTPPQTTPAPHSPSLPTLTPTASPEPVPQATLRPPPTPPYPPALTPKPPHYHPTPTPTPLPSGIGGNYSYIELAPGDRIIIIGNVSLPTLTWPTPIRAHPTPSPPRAVDTEYCYPAIYPLDDEFSLCDYVIELEKLPDEAINGVNCSHYRGRVDQDARVQTLRKWLEDIEGNITEATSYFLEQIRQQSFTIELWIDEDDYIRQYTIESRSPHPDYSTGGEIWITGLSATQYFDFNEVISINPPEIDGE